MALNDEKQGFSRRLRETLKRAGVDAGGPAALAREFNLRYDGTPVTVQAVRKWVSGNSLPSQDKIRALALWLEVSPQWLRYGEGEAAPAARSLRQDPASYRADAAWLSRKYEALNDAHKKMIVELTIALLRLEGKR
jgi:transcriptional regulator with XRE-family HTH domain